MRWKKVDGESVVESRKKCIVINEIGLERMKGEKKEMPKKIENKKTRNTKGQLSNVSQSLVELPWGCGLAHLSKPTRAAVPAANSCRQPYSSSCPTAMPPHSFGSCSPLPLAYTWPLPHREADLSNVSAISIIAPKDGRCKKLMR